MTFTYGEEVAYKRGFVDGDLFAEQRIIKLLEGECNCNDLYICTPHSLIALIEGENK